MSPALERVFTFLFKYPPRVFQRGDLVFNPVIAVPVLVAGVAIAAAGALYTTRRLVGIRPVDRAVLATLRIIAFVLIAGCLLRPALALSSAVPQRNVLAIVLDDSRSMRIRDVGSDRRLDVVQRTFSDSAKLVKQLSDKFALRFFRFSADAAPVTTSAAITGSGARTDLATAFESVRQELADVPVSGIVVASDGADNSTSDLSSALTAMRIRHLPVYTVGVGSERFQRDLSVDRLDVPTSTLKGSGAAITATIGSRGAAGDTAVVTTEADGRIVARDVITLPSGREVVDVHARVPPLDVGTHIITVRVSTMPGEVITENNAARALLRVRPGYERVLYIEGEPRFEFSFLRRAFDTDSAVRLVGLLRSAKGKYLRINVADSLDLVGGFPTRRDELFRYRAIILGNIEASFFTGDQLKMIADFVDRRGGTLIALGGRQTLAEGAYAGTPVSDVLPVTLEVAGKRPDTNFTTIRIEPSATGAVHPALQLGGTPAINAARWDSLPTLTSVNRLGELRPGATRLLDGYPQPRGDAQPVLAVQRYGRGLAAVFGVEDSWQWKMDPRTPVEDRKYETFWRQFVRWGLDQVPERVEVSAEPMQVGPGEALTLRARVVDSLYLPVNDGHVSATVTSPTGIVTTVPLEWTLKDDGSYAGRFIANEQGSYEVRTVSVRGNDSTMAPVTSVVADSLGADMDHAELRTALLERIAHETGGKYYPINDLSHLADDVVLTSSGITAHESRDIWDMPIVLLILLVLLGCEWAYRRWRGLA